MTESYLVDNVYEFTVRGGYQCFQVVLRARAAHVPDTIAQTLNGVYAERCRDAKARGVPVLVQTRSSVYGPEVTGVKVLAEAVA